MKIKDIQTLVVNAEMKNWVFVKIITDQDLYGWGEATVEWKTRAVVGAIEDLKPLLIGKDPRQIKQNYQIMTKHGFWKLGVIGMSAISGIEHAMWDILGKSLNTPVWQLLGGKVREKVKIYNPLAGSFAKVWTEFKIPDLTKKVPVTLKVNVIMANTIVQE